MAKHSIYGLFDPLKKEIFYIGQTCWVPKYRLYSHIATSKTHNYPVSLRISKMVEDGVNPEILILKEFEIELCILTNEKHGLFFEDIYIKEYSALGTLLNINGNPFYDRKNKVFIQPENKKELKCVNGNYYMESNVIKYLHRDAYNPFKNSRFISKILQ